jgi:Leucine Rich repeat
MGIIDISDVYASINHNLLLEAIKPLQQVVIRGISPQRLPKSSRCNSKPCHWQSLTLKNCNVTHEMAESWIAPSISTLETLILSNCHLSSETMQSLSEAYLEYCTKRDSERYQGKRKKNKKTRKAPLRVLNLSENTWKIGEGDDDDGNGSNNASAIGVYSDQIHLRSRSCMSSLATWMDSLSNLVELNLSNNPRLFLNGSGMAELCGTFHHSLQRLSLRHCDLQYNDLHALVNTFCWIEALDLSENSALLENLSPLLTLEHLSELVLENMSENGLAANDNSPLPSGNDQALSDYLQALSREEQGVIQCNDGEHLRRPLRRLNLSGNILQDTVLHAISELPSLKVLILMNCQLESKGLIQLLGREESMRKQDAFPWRELYLGSNNIGDEGAIALARCLKNQSMESLRVLQLESNVISVNAIRQLVCEGLAYSLCLESMVLWDFGAHTPNQQKTWQEVENVMHHYLLLNQAGRKVLFSDRHEEIGHTKKIPSRLWPNVLEEADHVHGADALYYFLHKRPDLILPSQEVDDTQSTHTPVKHCPPAHSPRGVADLDFRCRDDRGQLASMS